MRFIQFHTFDFGFPVYFRYFYSNYSITNTTRDHEADKNNNVNTRYNSNHHDRVSGHAARRYRVY